MNEYQSTDDQLKTLLGLTHAPIAITFLDAVPDNIPGIGVAYPEPTEDGRTGAVAASCVFWTRAHDRTFATTPSDHGNCSVGSLTHGLIPLEEAATRADVQAICEAKWVDPEIFPHIPTVAERPESIVYGPLSDATSDPDIVLLRLVAKQAMQLHSAVPSLQFEGKPQCHIIPIAREQQNPAVSVGCMLSRVRTGMNNNEMTCAIPFGQLKDIIEALTEVCAADRMVAGYASQDAARFRE